MTRPFWRPPAPPAPPTPPSPPASIAQALNLEVQVTPPSQASVAPAKPKSIHDHLVPQTLGDNQRRAFAGRGSDDIDLVTQTLVGARVWAATPAGLVSQHRSGYVWEAGENVAVCRRRATVQSRYVERFAREIEEMGGARGMSARGIVTTTVPYPCSGLRDTPDCPHGFYAYTGGPELGRYSSNTGSTVAGLIEGYGIVRCGTNGFIAEKARIVALIVPELDSERDDLGVLAGLTPMIMRRAVVRRYPDVPTVSSWDELELEHPELVDRLVETAFTLSKK